MSSVLGLNEYQTPFGAWCEITKLVKLPFEDTKYTIAGKAIEPKLIDYMKASGKIKTEVYGTANLPSPMRSRITPAHSLRASPAPASSPV